MPDADQKVPANAPQGAKKLFIVTQPGCGLCPDYAKMVAEAAPKGVELKEISLGENPMVDSILVDVIGVQRTPTVLYVADGKLQGVVIPTGVPEVDRSAIANIQGKDDKEKEVAKGCPVQFKVGSDGWEGVVKDSKACRDELNEANQLGTGSRRVLGQHLTSPDKAISDLIENLKKPKRVDRSLRPEE